MRKPTPPSIADMRIRRGGETLIHVYYTRWSPDDFDDRGHLLQRGKVSADLGLETGAGVDFANEEMQRIAQAAKFAAIKCIAARAALRKARTK